MKRIYTASKLRHGKMWRAICAERPDVFFHARWLKHDEMGTPDEASFAYRFWVEDHEDVASADVVLIYADETDHLRGALVEAGIALALKIPVVLAGTSADFGTWQYHPGVFSRHPSIKEALDHIRDFLP